MTIEEKLEQEIKRAEDAIWDGGGYRQDVADHRELLEEALAEIRALQNDPRLQAVNPYRNDTIVVTPMHEAQVSVTCRP